MVQLVVGAWCLVITGCCWDLVKRAHAHLCTNMEKLGLTIKTGLSQARLMKQSCNNNVPIERRLCFMELFGKVCSSFVSNRRGTLQETQTGSSQLSGRSCRLRSCQAESQVDAFLSCGVVVLIISWKTIKYELINF